MPDDGVNILCRIKELGNKSPTMKIPRSVFGETVVEKYDNFLLTTKGAIVQRGQYLQCSNCMVSDIVKETAVEFDVDGFLAKLDKVAEESDTTEQSAPFVTE